MADGEPRKKKRRGFEEPTEEEKVAASVKLALNAKHEDAADGTRQSSFEVQQHIGQKVGAAAQQLMTIQEHTKASINVDTSKMGEGFFIFVIQGAVENVTKAERLMLDVVTA